MGGTSCHVHDVPPKGFLKNLQPLFGQLLIWILLFSNVDFVTI